MGLLLFALIFTQVVFFLLSRTLASLGAVFSGLVLLVHQLALGLSTAGFSLFGLFRIPGPVIFVVAILWFASGVVFLIRNLRADPEFRKGLVHGFLDALNSNAKIYLMIVGLVGLMFATVYPLVTLVQKQPVLFRLLAMIIILALTVFLLFRKYRNMEQLDVADTRRDRTRAPLLLRFLYASLFKPLLIVFVFLAYLYVLYTAVVSPVLATAAFLLLTFLLTLFSRRIKRHLQPGV